MFTTHRPPHALVPTAEAIDQWFENLQNYEATLVCFFCDLARIATDLVVQEEMAAASLDVNFKEELSAIEQCEPLIHPAVS